jgi:hypothetical protein
MKIIHEKTDNMKRVVLLVSSVVLIAGLTFAQSPQTQKTTTTKPVEKKEAAAPQKDAKSGCTEQQMKSCSKAKTGTGCCAKDKKAETPAATPEKK